MFKIQNKHTTNCLPITYATFINFCSLKFCANFVQILCKRGQSQACLSYAESSQNYENEY